MGMIGLTNQQATLTQQNLTGITGTTLTIPGGYTAPYLIITKNGADLQPGVDYTAANGTSATLTTAAISSDVFVARSFGTFSVASPSFSDAGFEIYDNVDATKKVQFQASGITTGTTRTLTVPDANGTLALLGLSLQSKVVMFSRDTTAASGSQAITGVGFKPRAIICFSNEGSVTVREMSVGFCDSALGQACMFGIGDNAGFSYSPNMIFEYQSTENTYVGAISSLDSDGFTVAWTKTGSPSGTLVSYVICLA